MAALTIIVPVHNGARHIRPLAAALEAYFSASAISSSKTRDELSRRGDAGSGPENFPETPLPQLFLIDDGSTDESWDEIRKTAAEQHSFLEIKGVRLGENRGQQAAILAGLAACENPTGILITMDDDLSHPVEMIGPLSEAVLGGADLVYANPPHRPGRLLRRTASKLHQLHLVILTGYPPDLRVGSYRAMSASLVRRILEQPGRWIYISAMALNLRPRLKWKVIPSPEWNDGDAGRFAPCRLLIMEFRLALHYGPWTRIPGPPGRARKRKLPTAAQLARGWISETTLTAAVRGEKTS